VTRLKISIIKKSRN